MGKTRQPQKTPNPRPLLNVDFRPFFLFGLLFILFISPFMRGLFFPSEFLTASLFVGGTFIFCIYDQVLRREIFVPRAPLDWAVLALVLAYALSLVNAVHMRPALDEFMEAAACTMLYLCAVRAVRREKDLDLILTVCCAAGFGVALIGLLAAVGLFPFPGAYANGTIMSTFQYKNALAVYLLLLNVIGLGLSIKGERLWPKIFFALVNFVFIVVILGTQSRGGWLIYPLAVGCFIALLPPEYRWRGAYHIMIALGCALVASRGFYTLLRAKHNVQAGLYVIYGAVAVVALQVAYHFLARWLNRAEVTDATRRLVAIGGLVYFLLVGVFYVYASAGALPVSGAQVLPVDVVRRAETISGYDPSFRQRLEYARDALRIVKDYPVTGAGGGGWNALYHRYQSSLYWSTETHNHFLQTWVEAGTIGFLALLGVWIAFVLSVVRFWRHAPREGLWVSVSAAGVGVLALGLHSAFDFDLSLPALTFLVFVFFGGIRAVAPAQHGEDGTAHLRVTPAKLAVTALLGTIAGMALILAVGNLYAAGTDGAMGARALLDKDLATAKKYYTEAHRRDPFTASYAADLAQVYAAEAVSGDDALKHYKAIALAQKAARAEPYNIQVRSALVNTYLLLKEPALAVREAEALLAANPMLASSYEIAAAARVEAARHYLRQGKAEQAHPFLRPVDDLVLEMQKRRLEPTPELALRFGQIDLLAGRYSQAKHHLEAAAHAGNTEIEAKAWLAVALARTGDAAAAGQLAGELEQKAPQGLKLYESLRKESLSWKNL